MTSTIPGVDFRPLTIPADITAEDAADFVEMTRVRNAVYAEIGGNDDDSLTAAELLPHYQPDPDETRYIWAVIADGAFVGRVGVDIPREDGSRAAYWLIELLASHHGRAIGTAAYALVERTARAHRAAVVGTARTDRR